MKIYFSTSSQVKIDQYSYLFAEYGIGVSRGHVFTSLIEPQLEDGQGYELLVTHPLRAAARFITQSGKLPFLIEDTIMVIDALSSPQRTKFGLPGADTKSWWKNLGAEGLLKIMQNVENRSAKFISVLGVYLGGNNYLVSISDISGKISGQILESNISIDDYPRSNPHYFHKVFIPNGSNKSYAQMSGHEFSEFDYRRKNVKKIAPMLLDHEIKFNKQLELF